MEGGAGGGGEKGKEEGTNIGGGRRSGCPTNLHVCSEETQHFHFWWQFVYPATCRPASGGLGGWWTGIPSPIGPPPDIEKKSHCHHILSETVLSKIHHVYITSKWPGIHELWRHIVPYLPDRPSSRKTLPWQWASKWLHLVQKAHTLWFNTLI